MGTDEHIQTLLSPKRALNSHQGATVFRRSFFLEREGGLRLPMQKRVFSGRFGRKPSETLCSTLAPLPSVVEKTSAERRLHPCVDSALFMALCYGPQLFEVEGMRRPEKKTENRRDQCIVYVNTVSPSLMLAGVTTVFMLKVSLM